MFAFYAKESGRQAPTMDSSKNGAGSTTCGSLKVMKEGSTGRREEKQRFEDMGFEDVLQGIESEEGRNKRREGSGRR